MTNQPTIDNLNVQPIPPSAPRKPRRVSKTRGVLGGLLLGLLVTNACGAGLPAADATPSENTRVPGIDRGIKFNGEVVTRFWELPPGATWNDQNRVRYPQQALAVVPDCTDGPPIYVQEDLYRHETGKQRATVAALDAAGVLEQRGDSSVILRSWRHTIVELCEPDVEEPSVEPSPEPSTPTTPPEPDPEPEPSTEPCLENGVETDPESCPPQPTDEPEPVPTSITVPVPAPAPTETVEVEVPGPTETVRTTRVTPAAPPVTERAPAAVAVAADATFTG